MKSSLLGILSLLIVLSSCDNSTPDVNEGKLNGLTYSQDYLGWKMELPENFEFVSEEAKQKWSKATKEALGESYSIDKEQIDLISFRINEGIFLSHLNFRENFPHFKSEMQYLQTGAEQTKKGLEQVNITPSFEYDKETIGGKEFTVQQITHYHGDQIVNNQKVLLSFDDYFMFLIVVSWKNPDEKEIILNALNNSTFKE
jgi:hypothetical protein